MVISCKVKDNHTTTHRHREAKCKRELMNISGRGDRIDIACTRVGCGQNLEGSSGRRMKEESTEREREIWGTRVNLVQSTLRNLWEIPLQRALVKGNMKPEQVISWNQARLPVVQLDSNPTSKPILCPTYKMFKGKGSTEIEGMTGSAWDPCCKKQLALTLLRASGTRVLRAQSLDLGRRCRDPERNTRQSSGNPEEDRE